MSVMQGRDWLFVLGVAVVLIAALTLGARPHNQPKHRTRPDN